MLFLQYVFTINRVGNGNGNILIKTIWGSYLHLELSIFVQICEFYLVSQSF